MMLYPAMRSSRSLSPLKTIRAIALLTTSVGLFLPPLPASAQSLPQGGSVVSGEVVISGSGSNLLVAQSSRNAIISWDGFSIGAGARAHFENGTGATLNRVTGNLPSTINGSLTATGSLYLINPAGVAVGTGGMVRTGGTFVASTHNVSDTDFVAGGDMVFSGTSRASVVNEGLIASLGGSVVLTGRRVENTGTIIAEQGNVGLLAGYEILLRDLATDEGQFAVRIGGKDTEVVNTGTIHSAHAELRANGGNVYALAGNTNGVISATGVKNEGGRIFLTAGEDGTVKATQKIVARPAAKRAAVKASVPTMRSLVQDGVVRISADRVILGGEIDVSGDTLRGGTIIAVAKTQLELLSGARLDASGAHGGRILLGGDWQGGADAATKTVAENIGATNVTLVSAGASIRADGATGAGGTVVVWADQHTNFAGQISATGVTRGGNAEVSGKATLVYDGNADLRSETGAWGTLLLDPYNITISSGAQTTGSGFSANGNDSVINATTLLAALNTANVRVFTGDAGAQTGNIVVNADLSWATAATLTLDAAGSIMLNNAIAAHAGGMAIKAGGAITTGAGGTISIARFALESGSWSQNTSNLPAFAAGDFRLNGGSFLRAMAGDGSSANPWLLTDIYGLQGMATLPTRHYALANSIDASSTLHWNGGLGFVPIGRPGNYGVFTGSLNGRGNLISNLIINRPSESNTGLFGYTNGAVISNIELKGGAVSGQDAVGALAGMALGGSILNSHASVKVDGDRFVGGLAGQTVNGSIDLASASGSVDGRVSVGGLVGYLGGSLTRSSATGAVTAVQNGGGLVGMQQGAISLSHATGTVSGSSGSTHLGGLVGYSGSGGITQSYASGAINGGSNVGGLVGTLNAGNVMQVHATGAVNGSDRVGGLIGAKLSGAVTQAYASGAVSGGTSLGGLVGLHLGGTIVLSYWDRETTGRDVSSGSSQSFGLSTAQARTAGSYDGWDFGAAWYQSYDLRPMLRDMAAPLVDGVYQVSNLYQLQLMDARPSRSYVLIRDVDATGTAGAASSAGIWGAGGFTPIGGWRPNGFFTGSLDGRGHTITGVTVNRASENDAGVFGYVDGATISNLHLKNTSITGRSFVGGLAGVMTGGTSVKNVALEGGAVSGGNQTGGLAGMLRGSTANNVSVTSLVTGLWYVGGLVGQMNGGAVAGGVTGGVTTGNVRVGGLIGHLAENGSVTGSGATGSVNGQDNTGGLVGLQEGTITRSYATGAVSGSSNSTHLGGLVGYHLTGDITQSYASGAVSGGSSVGGLVGTLNVGNVTQVHATGATTGNDRVGGLIGLKVSGTVTQGYASGAVSGATNLGGLVGAQWGGTVVQSYWDRQTTGLTTSSGSAQSFGLTTAQARTASSYVAWDFGSAWYQSFDLRPMLRDLAAPVVDGVHQVANLYQLQLMDAYPSRDYVLVRDINAAATASTSSSARIWGAGGFTPIGGWGSTDFFTGSLDGRGHTISGLTVNRASESKAGLFGYIDGAVISNLRLWNASITGLNYIGSLAGVMHEGSTITNVRMEGGSVTGQDAVGGVVGQLNGSGDIADVETNGMSIVGNDLVGGLAGHVYGSAQIANVAVNDATIAARHYTGGLIGLVQGSASIAGSHVAAAVTGRDFVGGLVGYLVGGNAISRSFSAATVSGRDYVGGLVGYLGYGSIELSYATGAVSATANGQSTGGLVGGMVSGRISQSYASGTVKSGYSHAGGLVGDQYDGSSITQSYATGAVTGSAFYIGGLVGLQDSSTISQSYATGMVGGSSQRGGLVGWNGRNSVVASSFWNTQTTGRTSGTGGAGAGASFSATGLTTQQFQNTAGFKALASAQGWAFNETWVPSVAGSYPALLALSPDILVEAPSYSRAYGDTGTMPLLRYHGFKAGEFLISEATLSGLPGAMANVGTYQVSAIGGATSLQNRQFQYLPGTMQITPRAITVTANNLQRTYGDANPVLSWVVGGAGLVNGDTLSGALATSATAISNVGTHAINQGTLSASSNYAVTFDGGTLSVGQRAITVTADNLQRVYGNANPVLSWVVGGAGLVNGDTLSGALATSATAISNVGTYTINQGTLSASSNYAVTFDVGTLSVGQRAITVTADNLQRIYGNANPTLSWVVGGAGLVNGDTLSGALATSATATSNVGTYAIDQGTLSAGDNYAVAFDGGTLSVGQRAITVTANNFQRVYGNANPTLSWVVGGAGLVNGDTLSGALATDATATSNVGTYAITQGTLGAGGNYTMTFDGGTLSIGQRVIIVTADNLSKFLGAADPNLTWRITGGSLASSDALGSMLSGALVREQGEAVGTYRIGRGGLVAEANYALNFLGGILVIEPSAVTVSSLTERSLPAGFVTSWHYSQPGEERFDEDVLGRCGPLGQEVCPAFPYPDNRTIEHVRFVQ